MDTIKRRKSNKRQPGHTPTRPTNDNVTLTYRNKPNQHNTPAKQTDLTVYKEQTKVEQEPFQIRHAIKVDTNKVKSIPTTAQVAHNMRCDCFQRIIGVTQAASVNRIKRFHNKITQTITPDSHEIKTAIDQAYEWLLWSKGSASAEHEPSTGHECESFTLIRNAIKRKMANNKGEQGAPTPPLTPPTINGTMTQPSQDDQPREPPAKENNNKDGQQTLSQTTHNEELNLTNEPGQEQQKRPITTTNRSNDSSQTVLAKDKVEEFVNHWYRTEGKSGNKVLKFKTKLIGYELYTIEEWGTIKRDTDYEEALKVYLLKASARARNTMIKRHHEIRNVFKVK